MIRKKRIFSMIVVWLLIVSQFVITPVPAYADYEPDDDFFAFVIEYVIQRNKASQLKGYYDQYKKTGISLETAWELAKAYVSNNYTDTMAGLASIKNTYKNLTSAEQWKLLDFYNQVKGLGIDFNIDINLYNSLNLDLFSRDVFNVTEYRSPVNYEGYIPVNYSVMKNVMISEFLGKDATTSAYMSDIMSCQYIEFYNLDSHVGSSSGNIYSVYYVVAHKESGYLVPVRNEYSTSYSYTFDGGYSGLYTEEILSTSGVLSSYLYGGYAYSVGKSALGSQTPGFNLSGRYQVISDFYVIDSPSNIYNYNVTNVYNTDDDVQIIPYTQYNPLDDPNWLDVLRKICDGQSVPTINITFNPEPDTGTDPGGDDPLPSDGDDDTNGFLNSIVRNQGWIIDAINNVREAVRNVGNDIYTGLQSLNDNIYSVLTQIIDYLKEIVSYLKPDSDNFLLKNIKMPEINVKIVGDNDDGNSGMTFWEFLWNVFDKITDFMGSVLDYLNPFSDKFFLKVALIPEEGFMDSELENLRLKFEERIPAASQIIDLTNSYISVLEGGAGGDVSARSGSSTLNAVPYSDSNNAPFLGITLPEAYGGGTFEIIDFSYFGQYRTVVHMFIRLIATYFFVRRFLRRLPRAL